MFAIAAQFEPSVTGNLNLARPKDRLEVCFQSKAKVRICELEACGIAGLYTAYRRERLLGVHGLEKITGLTASFEQLLPPNAQSRSSSV